MSIKSEKNRLYAQNLTKSDRHRPNRACRRSYTNPPRLPPPLGAAAAAITAASYAPRPPPRAQLLIRAFRRSYSTARAGEKNIHIEFGAQPPAPPAHMPAHHDTGYKLLFSDPLMVRDLLLGFVDDPWLARLDFSTLELVNSHYVSEDLRNRADDVVWRVRADERWVYLYLLIEFQSSVDRFMALRMLVYVGLLYQDLVRHAQSRIRHRTSADRHLATCRLAAQPQIPHPSPRAR